MHVCEIEYAGSLPCPAGHYLTGVTSIAAGGSDSFAVLSNGTAVGWGSAVVGLDGNDGTGNSEVPVQVCETEYSGPGPCPSSDRLTGVTVVAAGYQSALAELQNGGAVAWGDNTAGELGTGSAFGGSSVPLPVCAAAATPPCSAANNNLLAGVSAVAVDDADSYALDGGTVLSWGGNEVGELGIATTSGPEGCLPSAPCSTKPVTVCEVEYPGASQCPAGHYLGGVTAISASGEQAFALLGNGTVAGWGGRLLGDGGVANSDVPMGVCAVAAAPPCSVAHGNLLSGVTAIAAGAHEDLALAPAEPHWYSDGKLIGSTPEAVQTKGTLTLHVMSGATSVTCKVKDSETVENPVGGGAGTDTMSAFTFSGCKATPKLCGKGEKPEVHANPPWSSKLVAGPPVRDEIAGIELKLVCRQAAAEHVLDVLTGSLTPEVGNSALEFGAGSGELSESVGGVKATVTGTDKLKGPKKDREITG